MAIITDRIIETITDDNNERIVTLKKGKEPFLNLNEYCRSIEVLRETTVNFPMYECSFIGKDENNIAKFKIKNIVPLSTRLEEDTSFGNILCHSVKILEDNEAPVKLRNWFINLSLDKCKNSRYLPTLNKLIDKENKEMTTKVMEKIIEYDVEGNDIINYLLTDRFKTLNVHYFNMYIRHLLENDFDTLSIQLLDRLLYIIHSYIINNLGVEIPLNKYWEANNKKYDWDISPTYKIDVPMKILARNCYLLILKNIRDTTSLEGIYLNLNRLDKIIYKNKFVLSLNEIFNILRYKKNGTLLFIKYLELTGKKISNNELFYELWETSNDRERERISLLLKK